MPKVIHFEVPSDDVDRALKFYSNVSDWKTEKIILNGIDHFFIFPKDQDDESFGHITKRERHFDSIINYMGITSFASYHKRVTNNGGKVIIPKTAINDIGFYSLCEDSEGNKFGLWEENKKP